MAHHPEMAAGISEEDKDMLSYMITLEVEEEDQPSNCCTISLFFRNDPDFHNGLLVKEFFLWHTTGYRASRSTPIQWRTAYKDRAYSHSQYHRSPNFFGWFTDHSSAGCERMTQIILEDLWINPLPCYLKSKKPPEEGAGPPEMLWSLGVNPAQDVHLPGWSVEAEHRVESAGCGKSGDL
ncbi:testis-specific Y-encoded protein 3 isoform X1 [Fukomys damarensis]|uniref:testis-specific Y-encoded protein 3 isoform X1 n=1 Tax=Fukomys damarensis TaxID=885580 RepID=UPI0005402230|nr:testis-specific Y-encoded protein 3 isoform X1 [Fukomys damarensis]